MFEACNTCPNYMQGYRYNERGEREERGSCALFRDQQTGKNKAREDLPCQKQRRCTRPAR